AKVKLSIVLWDLKTGEPIERFLRHQSWVTALAFAPDGKRFVSGGHDGTAFLWDIQARQATHVLQEHNHLGVSGVAFSPDGSFILTGGGDRNVLLWDATNGKLVKRFDGHSDEVTAVAFGP